MTVLPLHSHPTPRAHTAPRGRRPQGCPVAAPATRALPTLTPLPDDPHPDHVGDGTDGPDLLAEPGVVRHDLRVDARDGEFTDGVPLALRVAVVEASTGRLLRGAAVALWHADPAGEYAGYGAAARLRWLRGVQPTSAEGVAGFTTVVPGCTSGEWPHVHVAVFGSLFAAVSGVPPLKVTRLALPGRVGREVFAEPAYWRAAARLLREGGPAAQPPADNAAAAVLRVLGDAHAGYRASLVVPVVTRSAGARPHAVPLDRAPA